MSTTFHDDDADLPPHPAVLSRIAALESLVTRDEGRRGILPLILPGELLRAAVAVARIPTETPPRPPSAIVLSGFPCRVDRTPPTETDGPPGAAALARACLALGYGVVVVTDDCNAAVFREACRGLPRRPEFEVVSFPPELTAADERRMEELVHGGDGDGRGCDLILACERAGKAMDGRCYTMTGVDMTQRGLVAPLDRIVETSRRTTDGARFIAIGDGGNEMGMGKVYDAVRENIKLGEKIGAATAADDLIVASVSNWGAYALAAAAAVVRCYDEREADDDGTKERTGRDNGTGGGGGERAEDETPPSLEKWVNACVPTEEEEVALLNRCVAVGCRDGVSGKMEATVDGMPLETSMECLRNIRSAAMD